MFFNLEYIFYDFKVFNVKWIERKIVEILKFSSILANLV